MPFKVLLSGLLITGLSFSGIAQVEMTFGGNIVSSGSSNPYTVTSYSVTQVLELTFKNLSAVEKNYTVIRTRIENPSCWVNLSAECGILGGLSNCYPGNQNYSWSTVNCGTMPGETILYRDLYDVSCDSCMHYRYYLVSQEAGTEDSLDVITCESLELGNTAPVQFSVYPNPSYGSLHIVSERSMNKIELVDLEGKIVYTEAAKASTFDLQCTGCVSGSYVLLVHTEQGLYQERIEILREE